MPLKRKPAEPKVTFSLRITRRTRFGLIVQMRMRDRTSLDKSAYVEDLVLAVLAADKARIEEFSLPVFDALWDDRQWVRLQNLQKFDPDLLNRYEQHALGELEWADEPITEDYWAPISDRYALDI